MGFRSRVYRKDGFGLTGLGYHGMPRTFGILGFRWKAIPVKLGTKSWCRCATGTVQKTAASSTLYTLVHAHEQ